MVNIAPYHTCPESDNFASTDEAAGAGLFSMGFIAGNNNTSLISTTNN